MFAWTHCVPDVTYYPLIVIPHLKNAFKPRDESLSTGLSLLIDCVCVWALLPVNSSHDAVDQSELRRHSD